jgi:hypothetical protein
MPIYTPPKIDDLTPDFIRLPSYGQREPRTQLTRTALDQLTRPQECNDWKPPVASRLFSQGGGRRPIRLVDFKSLLRYLHSLPDGGRKENIVPRGIHAKQADASLNGCVE